MKKILAGLMILVFGLEISGCATLRSDYTIDRITPKVAAVRSGETIGVKVSSDIADKEELAKFKEYLITELQSKNLKVSDAGYDAEIQVNIVELNRLNPVWFLPRLAFIGAMLVIDLTIGGGNFLGRASIDVEVEVRRGNIDEKFVIHLKSPQPPFFSVPAGFVSIMAGTTELALKYSAKQIVEEMLLQSTALK